MNELGNPEDRQHLFLLCGLPFSGKSTMGRAMEAQLGIVHVEVDRHHLEGAEGFEGRRLERADWIAAYRASYVQVETALNSGRSVVFDAVSYRRTQRDRIRRIATRYGVPMTILQLDVSPEVAKARMVANRVNPVRAIVPDADFDEVRGGMQPPMDDEPCIRFDPSEPLADWITREIAPMVQNRKSR